MDALVADLEFKMAQARLGGGTKAVERMKKQGKRLPRERSVNCTSALIHLHLTTCVVPGDSNYCSLVPHNRQSA